MTDTENKVLAVETIVDETNAIAVPDPVRLALVRDLGPIAERLAVYDMEARDCVVTSQLTADEAAAVCDQIAADVRAVKDHEVLSRITDGLHKLHRRWTGLRDQFITPMETARKTIKGKVIDWQESEREKAEAEERRLQAIADQKAREEQARLQKKMEEAKRPETKARYEEQAAAVQAPTVRVEAPRSTLKVARVWAVKSISRVEFLRAAADNTMLQSCIEIKTGSTQVTSPAPSTLAKMKSGIPALTVPGVVFHEVVR